MTSSPTSLCQRCHYETASLTSKTFAQNHVPALGGVECEIMIEKLVIKQRKKCSLQPWAVNVLQIMIVHRQSGKCLSKALDHVEGENQFLCGYKAPAFFNSSFSLPLLCIRMTSS